MPLTVATTIEKMAVGIATDPLLLRGAPVPQANVLHPPQVAKLITPIAQLPELQGRLRFMKVSQATVVISTEMEMERHVNEARSFRSPNVWITPDLELSAGVEGAPRSHITLRSKRLEDLVQLQQYSFVYGMIPQRILPR